MKKVLAFILVLIICAAPVATLAHSDNTNAGTVPKVDAASAPAIDGVKDAVYNDGLFLPIRNGHSATPDGGLGGGADAWLLWDDEFFYVFIQMDIAGPTWFPDDYDYVKDAEQWNLTTLEVLVDFSNVSVDDNTDVVQFRADDRGYPNVTIRGTEERFFAGGDTAPYVTIGHVRNGDSSFTAEYKINYAAVKATGEEAGANLGGAWEAGKQIGMYLFAQETDPDRGQALFVSVATEQSGNWAPGGYDYVVLGDTVVGAVVEEAAPAADEPAAQEAPAAPSPAPAAPRTGDAGLPVFIIVTVLSLAVLVYGFKLKKVR